MSLLEELKSDRVDELAERADTRETIDRLRNQLSDQRAHLLRVEAKLADIDIAIAALEGEPAPPETEATEEYRAKFEPLTDAIMDIAPDVMRSVLESLDAAPSPETPAAEMIEDPLSDPPLYSADAAALPAETAGLDEDELVLDQPAEREDA